MAIGMDDYRALNRANWDERVGIHLRDTTGIYDFAAIRAGGEILGPIEAAEIGDVAGRRVLHLQCHFGLDTVSLARRGARATGLDFSHEAIVAARRLADELGVAVDYVEGDVYDAPALAGAGYDMVYTSWGTIGWLPDLERWAAAIAGCLATGGVFYMADGHPTLHMIEERDGRLEIAYDWRTPPGDPIVTEATGTYAGDGTAVRNSRLMEWNHPLSDILGALAGAGLALDFLHEHDRIPWRAFPSMVPTDDRMFVQGEGQKRIPLAFSLRAVKR